MNGTCDWRERAVLYWRLMRFDKPIGILLLLWPALWALWIAAEGHPGFANIAVFGFGVVLMRAAGCVINDYADRNFDPHVERTRQRPIAAGAVAPREALILFGVLLALAFFLVLTRNAMTVALSFAGAFLAASYPFTKRYTHLPQAYLGIAFGWAVPMAFAAETGSLPLVCWLLFLATALWALVYDTLYAMVDRDDDLKIGVKSTAILFGVHDRLIVGLIQLAMGLVLAWVGHLAGLGAFFWLGWLGAAGFFVYQQWLIKDRDKSRCFRAFLNNHWYGATLFAGIALDYAFR